MKRILYFVLASVMLVSVSCKKEPQQHEPQTVAVASVELDKTTMEATELDEFTLTATVLPDNATNKNVVWSVTDENILAVDQNGKVTAILAGTAKVVVTTEDGGFTAECTVTVKELIVPPTGVNILQEEYELEVGDALDMSTHLTVDGPGGFNGAVEWTSTDDAVAVVEDGKIVAKAAGQATLRAKAVHADVYDECLVKVYDKPTGVVMLRDGVALSEANPVDFEFSEEVTFEVKVLPTTAKQNAWKLVPHYETDKISDYFETSDLDTNNPKFKAIGSGEIFINLCYGADNKVRESFVFCVGQKLQLTASADEGFAGEGITLSTNISSAKWSASYSAKGYSVYKGNHPLTGIVTLVDAPGTDSDKILPLPMFKTKSGGITDAPVTVTVKTAHQTSEYVVTSKAWRPYFMDYDTKQELHVDDVGLGDLFSVGLKYADGEDILIQDWKDKILLEMGSGEDAYDLETTRADGYIYRFEEGGESYKIVLKGRIDSSVRYEQDFSPHM